MARRFRVVWSETAARDLVALAAHVALDSPAAARTLLTEVERRAASLATSPQRGRVVPELAFLSIRSHRELVLRPYRLIYESGDGTVRVLAVFDGRRDAQDLLLDRSIRDD